MHTHKTMYTAGTHLVQYGTRTPNHLLVYQPCTTKSWSPYFVNSQLGYITIFGLCELTKNGYQEFVVHALYTKRWFGVRVPYCTRRVPAVYAFLKLER